MPREGAWWVTEPRPWRNETQERIEERRLQRILADLDPEVDELSRLQRHEGRTPETGLQAARGKTSEGRTSEALPHQRVGPRVASCQEGRTKPCRWRGRNVSGT